MVQWGQTPREGPGRIQAPGVSVLLTLLRHERYIVGLPVGVPMDAHVSETIAAVLRRKGRDVWSVSPASSVYHAIELMADRHCRGVAGHHRRQARRNRVRA